jgi:hypothetical protein
MSDPASYPYDTIAYITDTIDGQGWQGSGALKSPDEVLTPSHVVYNSTCASALSRPYASAELMSPYLVASWRTCVPKGGAAGPSAKLARSPTRRNSKTPRPRRAGFGRGRRC